MAHWPIIKSQSPNLTQVLARAPLPPGTVLRSASMAGRPLKPDNGYSQIVLVSANGALASSIFAAERLRADSGCRLIVFAQFDEAVPFKPAPSQILMPTAPPGAIATVPLLDSWNIPSRLASPAGQNGFYQGDIRGLLQHWLQGLDTNERTALQILGFGEDRFLRGLKEWCESRRIPLRTAEIPS